MKREIIETADGSKTIRIVDWNEQYHSVHGAVQESKHVFIKHGLEFLLNELNPSKIRILEYGFGTGLNAYLTQQYLKSKPQSCSYFGLEAYPVEQDELLHLNYTNESDLDQQQVFDQLHSSPWDIWTNISENFSLYKHKIKFEGFKANEGFDLIYYDAFGARVQPELWELDMFRRAYDALNEKGCLVTYSSKGSVKRALEACGFRIEKLDGPPGKRHMLRAVKGW